MTSVPHPMNIAIGLVLALIVGGSATWAGLDRDRALYPIVMIVIASYYVLFAVMGGATQVLFVELAIGFGFVALAIIGFKFSLWFVVVALAAHGIFDLVHPHLYANPGAPVWWPMFCMAYDVAAAAYLAWLLATSRLKVRAD